MTPLADLIAHRRTLTRASTRRRPKTLPATPPPDAAALAYRAALARLGRAMDAAIHDVLADADLVPRRDAEGDAPDPANVPLVTPSRLARLLAAIRGRFAPLLTLDALGPLVDRVAERVNDHSRRGFVAQVQAATGVDPRGDAATAGLLRNFRRRNLALIKDLAGDKLDRVADALDAAQGMASKRDAHATIRDALGATQSRAELIAVTETHKLAAQLTESRHRAAGITSFKWSTVRDVRVRKEHKALHGREFGYDDPPVIRGEPTLPGHAPRCRCSAVPVLDERLLG